MMESAVSKGDDEARELVYVALNYQFQLQGCEKKLEALVNEVKELRTCITAMGLVDDIKGGSRCDWIVMYNAYVSLEAADFIASLLRVEDVESIRLTTGSWMAMIRTFKKHHRNTIVKALQSLMVSGRLNHQVWVQSIPSRDEFGFYVDCCHFPYGVDLSQGFRKSLSSSKVVVSGLAKYKMVEVRYNCICLVVF
jgi:hypothetical protein